MTLTEEERLGFINWKHFSEDVIQIDANTYTESSTNHEQRYTRKDLEKFYITNILKKTEDD